MNSTIQPALWHDCGRRWAISSIVLTLMASTYVMGTTHMTTPLIPAILSFAGVAGRSLRSASALRTCALVVVGLFAWLSLASVGFMFVPGAIAMLVALLRTNL